MMGFPLDAFKQGYDEAEKTIDVWYLNYAVRC